MLRKIAQPDHLQKLERARPVARPRKPAKLDRQQHVVEHGPPRQQHRRLEHHRGLRRGAVQWFAVELDRSCGGGQQSGEQLEQRRLSATALANDRDELAVEDLEVEVLKRRHLTRARRGIGLREAACADQRHGVPDAVAEGSGNGARVPHRLAEAGGFANEAFHFRPET